jgi:hypothetical protein
MPTLLGRAPKDSYPELLKLNNTGAGVTSSLIAVQDGTGVNTPLQLSTTQIALNGAIWPTSVMGYTSTWWRDYIQHTFRRRYSD